MRRWRSGSGPAWTAAARAIPTAIRLTYRWAFSSKPAASRAELAGADTATPSFMVDAPGSYVVALTVEDGQAASSSDTAVVTTPDTRPVANAGADQTVALGERATLSGAASNDADGDALTYRWRLESRPAGSVASLGGLSGVESSLVPDVPGQICGAVDRERRADGQRARRRDHQHGQLCTGGSGGR